MRTEHITNPTKYNKQILEAWEPLWVKNGATNYAKIESIFREYNADAGTLPTVKDTPAIILGSGPSLEDVFPYLAGWKGAIFCSSSQLAILAYHGITPTYCMIIDADPAMTYLVEEVETAGITLVTHPNMCPEVIKAWKGPIYFFQMWDPGNDYFQKYIPLVYGGLNHEQKWGIGFRILNSGCVVNALIAFAQNRGYSPIILAGVDLGFPGGHYRYRNVTKEKGTWVMTADYPEIPQGKTVLIAANGVQTDQVSIFYKYSLMIIYGMDAPPLLSCSRGIVSEVPHIPANKLSAYLHYGARAHSRADAYRIAQRYLIDRGIYIRRSQPTPMVIRKSWLEPVRKLGYHFYMILARLKGTSKHEARRRHLPILRAKSVRMNCKVVHLYFYKDRTEVVRPGIVDVRNIHSLKWYKRPWFLMVFWAGKLTRRW